MPQVVRFLFRSVGLAFFAWIVKIVFDDEEALSPETLVSRIRKSGF
jgi:hypothetical protein